MQEKKNYFFKPVFGLKNHGKGPKRLNSVTRYGAPGLSGWFRFLQVNTIGTPSKPKFLRMALTRYLP